MNGQLHASAALPPGKDPQVPIEMEAVWAPELVWMLLSKEKSLASAGSRTPAFQPSVRLCDDWAKSRDGTLQIMPQPLAVEPFHFIIRFMIHSFDTIWQACQNCGPRAVCGSISPLVRFAGGGEISQSNFFLTN
jgi:hypothetical protein